MTFDFLSDILLSMENSQENNDKKIIISTATAQDAEGMGKVFYKTWLATYPNKEIGITFDDIEDKFKNSFTEEGIKKTSEKITNPPEGKFTFLAKEGNVVVGVCVILVSEQENRIGAIYVLPEYQGKGIGKKLWEQTQNLFDSKKDTFVSLASYNTNAMEFYKKLGFEDTGRRWDNDEKFKMKSGAIIPHMEMVIKAKHNFI